MRFRFGIDLDTPEHPQYGYSNTRSKLCLSNYEMIHLRMSLHKLLILELQAMVCAAMGILLTDLSYRVQQSNLASVAGVCCNRSRT
jgi:hypothetical protein